VQARRFAEATGKRVETDPIDAAMLARFGATRRPEIPPVKDETIDVLEELLAGAWSKTTRRRVIAAKAWSCPCSNGNTATSFAAAVEDPENFKKSRSVGAWLGLTTRRYQSGEVDYDGHISRRGDQHLRGLLYEAATVILTRASADSGLRAWGLKLRERIGFKRAAVAVARKLAVTMHAMLKSGALFDRNAAAAAS
jgi:transposase